MKARCRSWCYWQRGQVRPIYAQVLFSTFAVTFLGHSFRKVQVLKPLAEQNLLGLIVILKQTSMTLLWIAERSDFDQSTKRFGATVMFQGETKSTLELSTQIHAK